MPDQTLAAFRPLRQQSRHEQITAFLRGQILSGALQPETRLPSTQELARCWGVPIATIQTACVPLVKEGLLLRRPGFGTVVCSSAPALTCIAIYQPAAAVDVGERFVDRLSIALDAKLAAAGIRTLAMTDRRPVAERTEPMPGLLSVVRGRQVDAVIATQVDERITPWMSRLSVPSVMLGSGGLPNCVWFDFAAFAASGVACLAERGCRSVGLVTVHPLVEGEPEGSGMHAAFQQAVAHCGLRTCEAWVRHPGRHLIVDEHDADGFGYAQVRALWAEGERPDGLLVYTDRVARGVVMGLLSLGLHGALPKLVLHRNAELGLFSPLPADFLETSAGMAADVLMAMITAQHRNQPLPSSRLPFRLVRG